MTRPSRRWPRATFSLTASGGLFGFSPAAQKSIEQLKLHYYLPFKVKERTLGYLGLGKTRDGDYLSSEDIDLLQTISGYVSIALENARLYESLEIAGARLPGPARFQPEHH